MKRLIAGILLVSSLLIPSLTWAAEPKADKIRIDDAGNYYTGTNVETALQEIGAEGYTNGSGTTNYVPKWSDTDTLTNSLIYDTGTYIGIGTTNPTYELEVVGEVKSTNLRFDEIATPTVFPDSNELKVYAKDDGGGTTKLYILDAGGVETELGAGGGATSFIALTDTPADYTDDGGKYVAVNVGETALEFVAAPSSLVTSVFGRTGDVVAVDNDIPWNYIDFTVSDIADITTRSHTSLTDIGTNTHAQVDTHIADGTIHFTDTFVHLTGDESVAGIKTFTSIPVLPASDPTTDNQAVRKAYVDTLVNIGIAWKNPVQDMDRSDPPSPSTLGYRYRVKPTGTGTWSGHDNDIATCTVANPAEWTFETPSAGWAVLSLDDNIGYNYNSSTWVAFNTATAYTASGGIGLSGTNFSLDPSDTNPALEIADNGVRVKVDDSTIERSSSGLQIKDAGVTNAKLTGPVSMSKGGTGLTTGGSANQVLGMNSAATGFEGKSIVGGSNVTVTQTPNQISIASSITGAADYMYTTETLHSHPTSSFTWTDMPLVLTAGSSYLRKKVDLTGAVQFRIIVNQATAGATNAEFRAKYSTNNSVFNDMDSDNSGDLAVGAGTGVKVGAWTDIVAGAKQDVWLQIYGLGGDGIVDAAWRQVAIQLKYNSSIVDGSTSSVAYREIAILAHSGSSLTWTNMPAATTELLANVYGRKQEDLSGLTHYRIIAYQSTAGYAGADFNLQYSLNAGSTWIACDTAGAGEVDVGTGTGFKTGAWTTLVDAAKGDVLLRIAGKQGDGVADPIFRSLYIQFKGAVYAPTAGADKQVIYNASGTATGENNLWWDYSNDRLGIGTTAPSSALDVIGAIASSTLTSTYVPVVNVNNELVDSAIDQDGSNVAVGNRNFKITNSFPQVFIDSTYSPTANTSSIDFRYGAGGVSTAWRIGSGVTKSEDNNFEIVEGLSANRMYFKPGGNIGIGTTNPQATLQLHSAASSDSSLYLSDGDVAHGMSDMLPTDVYVGILANDSAKGGLLIVGASDLGDTSGIKLLGAVGNATSTAASVEITAVKKDGTGFQNPAATEQAFVIGNLSQQLLKVYGDSETVWNNGTRDYALISPVFTDILGITDAQGIKFSDITTGTAWGELIRGTHPQAGIVNVLAITQQVADGGSVVTLTDSTGTDIIAMDSFGGAAEFYMREDAASPTAYTYFGTQDQSGADIRYTYPAAQGTAGQVLKINDVTGGVGNLAWVNQAAGSGTILGTIADTQVAFGTATDTIGGDAGFTWNNTNKVMTIASGTTPSAALSVTKTNNAGGNITVASFSAIGSTAPGAFLNISNGVATGFITLNQQNAIGFGIVGSTGAAYIDASNNFYLPATLKLLESGTSPSDYLNIIAGVQSGDISWTLPTAQGGASTYLKNNGSGVLSWDTPAGGSQTPWTSNINAAGYTLFGNNTANGDLTLEGTSDATKTTSYVILQPTSGNVGIGTTSPSYILHVSKSQNAATNIVVENANTGTAAQATMAALNDVGSFFQCAIAGSNYSGNGLADSSYFNSNASGGMFFYTTIASPFKFGVNTTEYMRISSSGNVGIGTTAPTAVLHLKAGTATASTAPLKFIAGTNMTNAEAGAMEWDGTNLFISQTSGPTRKTFAFLESPSFTTPNIGAATGTSLSVTGDIKNSTAGGGIYIKEGTNATMGVTTLASGTATVSTTKITANSRIFLTVQGGTLTNVGSTYISSTSAGSGFNISSTNILDASTVAWLIMEPS